MSDKIDRNLSLELIRATEAAALSTALVMGRGEISSITRGAAQAMQTALRAVEIEGRVVIGEGEEDTASYLYVGQAVGTGKGPRMDVAARAIDGARLLALGLPHAISIIAIAGENSLYKLPPGLRYMNKIVVGPEARGAISLDQSAEWNLRNIARAKHIDVREVTAVVLDRPRNQQLVREIRQAGARLHLISDGDIHPAMMAALPETGVDVLMGIGGAQEAVVTACLLKCLDGEMVCRLYPHNVGARQAALAEGFNFNEVLTVNDLVKSDNVFVSITGVTGGERLESVRYSEGGVHTHSIIMRSKSGTMRDVRARHRLDKLMRYSEIDFAGAAGSGVGAAR
ncbi:MAG: Fructose,6-bisphosphatase [Chloroflexi bacterium]|jgi:fructose-1,6-bisphosphatase II|nr:Fructose,6-bisphosphatase [Chloroflexota bacterium]